MLDLAEMEGYKLPQKRGPCHLAPGKQWQVLDKTISERQYKALYPNPQTWSMGDVCHLERQMLESRRMSHNNNQDIQHLLRAKPCARWFIGIISFDS